MPAGKREVLAFRLWGYVELTCLVYNLSAKLINVPPGYSKLESMSDRFCVPVLIAIMLAISREYLTVSLVYRFCCTQFIPSCALGLLFQFGLVHYLQSKIHFFSQQGRAKSRSNSR